MKTQAGKMKDYFNMRKKTKMNCMFIYLWCALFAPAAYNRWKSILEINKKKIVFASVE